MASLNMSKEKSDGKVKVYLSGEIDIYSAPEFKENLNGYIGSGKSDIVIDCTNLEYIDSTGLGVLVGVLKKVKEHDKSVYLQNMRDNVRKLFKITGLEKVFILEG